MDIYNFLNINSIIVSKNIDSYFLSSLITNSTFNELLSKLSFTDNRSLGYFSLANQFFNKKVNIIFTSGHLESLELLPSVTEAYYRNIPIVVFEVYDIIKNNKKSNLASFPNDTFKFLADIFSDADLNDTLKKVKLCTSPYYSKPTFISINLKMLHQLFSSYNLYDFSFTYSSLVNLNDLKDDFFLTNVYDSFVNYSQLYKKLNFIDLTFYSETRMLYFSRLLDNLQTKDLYVLTPLKFMYKNLFSKLNLIHLIQVESIFDQDLSYINNLILYNEINYSFTPSSKITHLTYFEETNSISNITKPQLEDIYNFIIEFKNTNITFFTYYDIFNYFYYQKNLNSKLIDFYFFEKNRKSFYLSEFVGLTKLCITSLNILLINFNDLLSDINSLGLNFLSSNFVIIVTNTNENNLIELAKAFNFKYLISFSLYNTFSEIFDIKNVKLLYEKVLINYKGII
jgi:hypothetical protein